MILCVNPNAAIDKTVTVNNFSLNGIYRPQTVLAIAGGKGCNVARALKTLGENPVLTGWVGGFSGQFIESQLKQEGIRTAFSHTAFESRTCLSILDPENNTLTELYEKGEMLSPQDIESFLVLFKELLKDSELVTFSGSLPPGAPSDLYATLIKIARDAGVISMLDSSGNALVSGLKDGLPDFVKPNRQEVLALTNKLVPNDSDLLRLAVDLSMEYHTTMVISLGASGIVAGRENEGWLVKPPVINAVSAVGSGDCLLAGMAYGLKNHLSFEDVLRVGVSAGTANALKVGAGRFNKTDFNSISPQIEIHSKKY